MDKKLSKMDSIKIEKPQSGQTVLKNIKHADAARFEVCKKKVFRDFDQNFRSLSKR